MNFTSLLQPVIIWLCLLVILVIAELLTMGLTTIWFAGGALISALLAMLHFSPTVQIAAFFIVSLGLLFSTRPIAVKYFNKDRVKTNAESLVGHQAIVVSEVDNVRGCGRVTIGGQEWSARSSSDDKKLPVGAVAYVIAINGVKLIIEEKEEELS
ncbi:MAG: NfeD family protein [Lachnospiraceae bacterium]|nr:NfeD family protein [Lachnospiraceae bacterium]